MIERPALLLYCQHSLGLGDLKRSWALASHLAEAFRVTLVSGGVPPAGLRPPQGIETIQLPPLAEDAAGTLLSVNPAASVDDVKAERRQRLVEIARDVWPDAIVVELFPFGRRKFHDEIIALLQEAHRGPRPVVATSVRDLLMDRGAEQQRHDDRVRAVVDEYFDFVLVHTDPRFATLDDTFHPSWPLTTPVHHTGFVVAERPADAVDGERSGILVSGGGGRFAETLYLMAIAAYDLLPAAPPMTIITGPLCPEQTVAAVSAAAQRRPGIRVERTVDDLCGAMRRAAISVSQCGYNTALDIVRAGVPAIVVPFDENGDTEQTIRAHRLEQLDLVRVVGARAGARALADAITAIGPQSRARATLDLGGGRRSTDILVGAVREPFVRRPEIEGEPT